MKRVDVRGCCPAAVTPHPRRQAACPHGGCAHRQRPGRPPLRNTGASGRVPAAKPARLEARPSFQATTASHDSSASGVPDVQRRSRYNVHRWGMVPDGDVCRRRTGSRRPSGTNAAAVSRDHAMPSALHDRNLRPPPCSSRGPGRRRPLRTAMTSRTDSRQEQPNASADPYTLRGLLRCRGCEQSLQPQHTGWRPGTGVNRRARFRLW